MPDRPVRRRRVAWNAAALLIAAGGLWVYYAGTIQERYDLYRTSSTMTLFSGLLVVIGVPTFWLMEQGRPRLAWLVAVLGVIAAGQGFIALTQAYPPPAPMGW